MKFKQWFINVFFPLIVGGMIYILFRSTTLNMFLWFDLIGIKSLTINLRQTLVSFKDFISPIVYYSLPNSLWVYSFTSALIMIWNKRTYFILIPLFFGCLIEFIQLTNYFPGTFDINDLLLSIVAFILANYLTPKQTDEKVEIFKNI